MSLALGSILSILVAMYAAHLGNAAFAWHVLRHATEESRTPAAFTPSTYRDLLGSQRTPSRGLQQLERVRAYARVMLDGPLWVGRIGDSHSPTGFVSIPVAVSGRLALCSVVLIGIGFVACQLIARMMPAGTAGTPSDARLANIRTARSAYAAWTARWLCGAAPVVGVGAWYAAYDRSRVLTAWGDAYGRPFDVLCAAMVAVQVFLAVVFVSRVRLASSERGRCPACGYPVSGHPGASGGVPAERRCPECGLPMSAAGVIATLRGRSSRAAVRCVMIGGIVAVCVAVVTGLAVGVRWATVIDWVVMGPLEP